MGKNTVWALLLAAGLGAAAILLTQGTPDGASSPAHGTGDSVGQGTDLRQGTNGRVMRS